MVLPSARSSAPAMCLPEICRKGLPRSRSAVRLETAASICSTIGWSSCRPVWSEISAWAGGGGGVGGGGGGGGRGYLQRPALPAEPFVPDNLGGEPGARLYRTGDLA